MSRGFHNWNRVWGIFCYNYNKEPPPKPYSNYFSPYSIAWGFGFRVEGFASLEMLGIAELSLLLVARFPRLVSGARAGRKKSLGIMKPIMSGFSLTGKGPDILNPKP